MKNPIKFNVSDDFDYVLEESNKMYTAFRKVGWNGRDPKIDIRKWYTDENNGEDVPGKGVSLTNEGANELAIALVKENFGSTKKIIRAIKNRDNFKQDLKTALETDEDDSEEENDEELYDASEII